jgi:tRNA(Ile2) C34 agmatinyltransferase TiaS
MVSCDTCGVPVSSTGYLGGGIVCKDCAKDKREHNVEALQARIQKHGGGDDYNGDVTELLY